MAPGFRAVRLFGVGRGYLGVGQIGSRAYFDRALADLAMAVSGLQWGAGSWTSRQDIDFQLRTRLRIRHKLHPNIRTFASLLRQV